MSGLEDARRAKTALREKLHASNPPWLRGIGLGHIAHGYCVKVNVSKITPEVQAEIRATIPEEIEGVPILIDETGDFRPLGSDKLTVTHIRNLLNAHDAGELTEADFGSKITGYVIDAVVAILERGESIITVSSACGTGPAPKPRELHAAFTCRSPADMTIRPLPVKKPRAPDKEMARFPKGITVVFKTDVDTIRQQAGIKDPQGIVHKGDTGTVLESDTKSILVVADRGSERVLYVRLYRKPSSDWEIPLKVVRPQLA